MIPLAASAPVEQFLSLLYLVILLLNQPQLLDDYSDPIDLKKQNAKLIKSLESVAKQDPHPDLQDTSDDDYSVPYELKKLKRGLRKLNTYL